MDKNAIIAGILSFIVIFGWMKYTDKQKIDHVQVATQQINETTIEPAKPEFEISATGNYSLDFEPFVLENDNVAIKIGNRGEFRSVIVKEKNNVHTELIYSRENFPMMFYPNIIYDSKPVEYLNDKRLILVGKLDDKILVETKYEFVNDGLVSIETKLKNQTDLPLNISNFKIGLGPGINTDDTTNEKHAVREMRSSYYSNGKFYKKPKVANYENIQNSWITINNQYFLSAILDVNNNFNKIDVVNTKLPELYYSKDIKILPNQTYELKFQTLWTIKNYQYLKSFDNDLQKSVSLGWFSSVGKLVMWLLQKFYNMTNNYGFAIILLTLLMQILLLPLNKKSYESMHKLKKIQPKLNTLKNKYKDDAQKLNMEMMALYKREQVNPFGGCLPILLQMPIFLALFNVLRNATELRYAPFIFWIQDLSRPDTLTKIFGISINVLPILMGVMMFLSQKLNTGKTDDPVQAKMLTFMPLLFLFMFWSFPSGLVLYWLFSNICTFGLNFYLSVKNKEEIL